MNAVTGVVLDGAKKSGALCADHWKALSAQPGLTFFSIPKNKRQCTLCTTGAKR